MFVETQTTAINGNPIMFVQTQTLAQKHQHWHSETRKLAYGDTNLGGDG